MEADNTAFAGQGGEQLAAIAAALSAGRSDLAGRVQVSPGVEVRSPVGGDLRLTSDWNLGASATSPVTLTLTLRADRDLLLAGSLSSGFASLATNSALSAGQGASMRLVGGADFGAADPLVVQRGAAQGDVVIGRAATSSNAVPPVVLVRSSTGRIDIASARDIRTFVETARPDGSTDRRSQVRIYTTGQALAQTPWLELLGIRVADQFLRSGTSNVGPFFDGAGDITLAAGRDLLGAPATVYNGSGQVQYVSDWWYRQSNTATEPAGGAFWSRYDLFGQGVASFGGGNVRAEAGRDIADLDLSTPFSGYFVPTADGLQQRWLAGGTLDVRAGRDVTGGLFFGGGSSARLVAGGALVDGANPAWTNGYAVPQLFYGGTRWTVIAQRGLAATTPTLPALMSGAAQGNERQPRTDLVARLGGDAQATLLSLAGDVSLLPQRPATSTSGNNPGVAAGTVPDEFRVVAPAGSIVAGALAQQPQGAAAFELFARQDVRLESLQLVAAAAPGAAPEPQAQASAENLFNPRTREWSRAGDLAATPPPARVVAAEGSLQMTGSTAFSARALRLMAGADIELSSQLSLQHPPADAQALTLLQAGRDLRMGLTAGLRVAGGGDVVAIGGRDIDFGRGTGIVSVGNQDNDLQLVRGGAGITLLAGITWDDYRQAVQRNFHLLGGGFEHHAPLLVVQLEALAAGGALLDAGAAQRAAAAYVAADVAEQRARVAAIVGADVLARDGETALAARVAQLLALSGEATQAVAEGRVVGSNRLDAAAPVPGTELLGGEQFREGASAAERAAQQASVTERLREALAGQALADALAQHVQRLGAATQRTLALAVSPYAADLQRFVQQRTGTAPAGAAEAAERFSTLAPEVQALFADAVLAAELRSAGRDALASSRLLHLRGYGAMDALFPGARPAGRITLSNSQAKTAQGGSIRLAAPGGSINVGDLAGGGIVKSASDVGIVTVAGGEISAAVRDSVEVNQSRIFTLAEGDILLWARLGNLDAGRGAKTVVGAPPPLVTFNAQGQLVVDTSGSFSGSGIAALDAGSALDLYAPLGEISAGEAGIKSAGRVFLGATRIVNVNDIQAPQVAGAPPPPPVAATAGLAGIAGAASAATTQTASAKDGDEEDRRRQRPRRNLFLDFLGFGRGG